MEKQSITRFSLDLACVLHVCSATAAPLKVLSHHILLLTSSFYHIYITYIINHLSPKINLALSPGK